MSVNQPPGFVKPQERTNDAFLGGKLSILQPTRGFRAGLDSVLLGAAVALDHGRLLDLGAGAGVAGLTALAHNARISATLVEIDPEMAGLAQENARVNGLADRTEVIALDVTARGAARQAAGLGTDIYDMVIANPPFFENGTLAPDAARAKARHIGEAPIADWVKTAVSCAHAGGTVIFIHRAEALPDLLTAFAQRMGDIQVLPIAPRPGSPATRVLIRGRKGTHAPIQLLAPLVLHADTGNGFAAEADAIFRGTAVLDWQRRR